MCKKFQFILSSNFWATVKKLRLSEDVIGYFKVNFIVEAQVWMHTIPNYFRKARTEGVSPIGPGHICRQLASFLQPNLNLFTEWLQIWLLGLKMSLEWMSGINIK